MKKLLAVSLLVVAFSSVSVKAELIYAVDVFVNLYTFDSLSPNTVSAPIGITGLTGQAGGESVIGLDFRPANGQLYAFGNAPGSIYRLYTINPMTGVATQVGADITGLFTGTNFGFDFNPVPDLIRIVNDGDQNTRFNPDTGARADTAPNDGTLAYAGGDTNAGANPNVVASAYTNNVPGAGSTTLYGIDSNLDILVTQIQPNAGTLNTVGPLGVLFTGLVGFDISGVTGTAFASSADPGIGETLFYTIDLSTGAATAVGEIGTDLIIQGLTAAPIPEPSTYALIGLAAAVWGAARLRKRKTA